jgi:DNA polymerase elongation subunit (family B)
VYASAAPIIPSTVDPKEFTISLAQTIETKLNRFYDVFAKKAFNCNTHRFFIKGESVASTGFWVSKKRYALDKVYDLETSKDVNKMVVKGLDVVRSSFPKAFREFMNQMLKDILKGVPKSEVDEKILNFSNSLDQRDFLDIARNTSANNISEYTAHDTAGLRAFKKGAPIHVKSAIVYNRLLKQFGIEKQYEPISDGEKIKYVYMKPNPYQIEALAIKGYQDPPQIIELIHKYIDTKTLFENELSNKLNDFYSALGWGLIPTEINQAASQFFEF